MEDTLVVTKTKYCNSSNCECERETTVVTRPASYTFKGETFEIVERVLICSECGEELYDEVLDTETMSKLADLYSERVGLPLRDIKSIRNQYGLSMSLFARILGWSKSSIVRYESGNYIPDISHMTILKRLKEDPTSIDHYYKMHKHKFNDKEQKKIEEKLQSSDKTTVERGLIEALHINYKLHDDTIESGYVSFSLNKLLNMILYFTRNGVQKTKLMKLLFYSDFLNYKRNLVSMSGTPYVKLPHGPVPKDHDLLLSTLEKNDLINTNYEFINEYTVINIESAEDFDENIFDEEELNILKQVEEHFKGFGSVAISNFSHEEDGWKLTENREVISYDYADCLKID